MIAKADGTVSNYAYDLAGRMTGVEYSDGTEISYGYNKVGSTTTMTDKTGTTTYQYDDMQRLVSTTDSNDKTVKYAYDILGRKTGITLPDGQTVHYEYDAMDRLTQVKDGTGIVAEYKYDANSQLISNVRNDITTTYEYNELGQIRQLTTSDINSQIQQFSYQYDKLGNITKETRTEGSQTNNRTYIYDEANQLIEFVDNNYVETYTYDNVGNMLTKNVNDILTEYTYNGNGNRLSESTDGETVYYVNDVNRRYKEVLQTYDEDGNTINTYTYGLQRIDSKGEINETYLYDGVGALPATRAIEEEIRKLEEDKESILNNVTKSTNSQTMTETKQPVNGPVRKVTRIGRYSNARPQLMAY